MIRAEWTSNDALSAEQATHSNAPNASNALDCISRQYAIDHYQHVCRRTSCKECPLHMKATDMGDTFTDCELELFLYNLPSAQSEPLTDKEQRIFLAAIGREEKVCKELDEEYPEEPYEKSLVRVCREIERKVKKALWMI